jgi:peptide/nickel transport system substrate-binding protein
MERAIKMPWGGSGLFITPVIVGGTAYSTGKANTISGITTNDSTGQITMHLTAQDGPWDNVLAFPALGLIDPKSAPMPAKNQTTNPPAGLGPYEVVKNSITPTSFTAQPNPAWASYNIPGIPAGHVSVTWKEDSNVSANAEAVLNNSADVFDWADTIPGSLLPQIKSQAASRYHLVDLGGSTYYIFMNSQVPPFNNQLAREAVVEGLNQQAMSRLGSGTLISACFFLPPFVPGHPTSGTCPYNNSSYTGNLAKAQSLVKASGMAGQPVTVWSETRTPRQQWMTYYTQFLNQIGFKATQKVIADANYFTTIGDLKLHPQTGFGDWNMDFPNPVDFYGVLLDGNSILPTNNENWGETNDPHVNSEVARLSAVPTAQLDSVAGDWQSLEKYVAQKALVAVFGYQTFPFFTSSRVNYTSAIFQPEYGWDWTSLSLK